MIIKIWGTVNVFSSIFFLKNTFHCFAATFLVYAPYLLSVFSYIQNVLFIHPSIFSFSLDSARRVGQRSATWLESPCVCALPLRLHANNSKHCSDLQCIVGKTMRNGLRSGPVLAVLIHSLQTLSRLCSLRPDFGRNADWLLEQCHKIWLAVGNAGSWSAYSLRGCFREWSVVDGEKDRFCCLFLFYGLMLGKYALICAMEIQKIHMVVHIFSGFALFMELMWVYQENWCPLSLVVCFCL